MIMWWMRGETRVPINLINEETQAPFFSNNGGIEASASSLSCSFGANSRVT